jgi:hypothetical protein
LEPEKEEPGDETADVGDVRHPVVVRSDGEEDVDAGQNGDEGLRPDRERDGERDQLSVRPERRVGQTEAQDRPGRPHKWGNAGQARQPQREKCCTDAAVEVVKKKRPAAHVRLDCRPENEQHQHVPEQVEKPTMHEHVCDEGPGPGERVRGVERQP